MTVFPRTFLFYLTWVVCSSTTLGIVNAKPLPVSKQAADKPQPRLIEYRWMSLPQWKKAHQDNLKRARSGPAPVLFIGDSITEAWQGSHGASTWKKYYAPLDAANFGIGGDTTQNVLWRITQGEELRHVKPRVIVLLIGTNNFGLGPQKPDQVVSGVSTIVSTIRHQLPETKILLLGIFPRDQSPNGRYRKLVDEANLKLAKLHDGHYVHFLNIGDVFLQSNGTISKSVMHDYLHLTKEGYRRWASAMAGPLDELLREPSPLAVATPVTVSFANTNKEKEPPKIFNRRPRIFRPFPPVKIQKYNPAPSSGSRNN